MKYSIKNSRYFILLILFFSILFLSGCIPPQTHEAKSQAVPEIIHEFSSLRLQYVLSEEQTPSNKEIMSIVAQKHKYNVFQMFALLKRERLQLYESLFGSDEDRAETK